MSRGRRSTHGVGDLDRLGLFRARCEDLSREPLITNTFRTSLTFEFDRMKGANFTSLEPNEHVLRSFLLTFRPFVLNDEPIYLHSVYNSFYRLLTSDELRGYLVRSRETWKQSLRSSGIKFVVDGREFDPEYVLDLWLNGFYFHTDPEKAAILRKMVPEALLLAKWHFLNVIQDTTRVISYVGNLIVIAMKDGVLRTEAA